MRADANATSSDEQLLDAMNADFERLFRDPEALAGHRRETALWDRTSSDSLDECANRAQPH